MAGWRRAPGEGWLRWFQRLRRLARGFLAERGIEHWSTCWYRVHLRQLAYWAQSPLLPPLLRWRGLLAWEFCQRRLR
eukprot:9512663-Prorocentrum_lima.AAC.1